MWARAVEPRADDDATAVAIRLLDALLTAHHGWSRAAGEPLLLRYALPRDAGSVTIDAVTVFDDLVLRACRRGHAGGAVSARLSLRLSEYVLSPEPRADARRRLVDARSAVAVGSSRWLCAARAFAARLQAQLVVPLVAPESSDELTIASLAPCVLEAALEPLSMRDLAAVSAAARPLRRVALEDRLWMRHLERLSAQVATDDASGAPRPAPRPRASAAPRGAVTRRAEAAALMAGSAFAACAVEARKLKEQQRAAASARQIRGLFGAHWDTDLMRPFAIPTPSPLLDDTFLSRRALPLPPGLFPEDAYQDAPPGDLFL